VAGLRSIKKLGGNLKVLNVSDRVHSTLYIAKLLPIFEIYEDEKEALARFRQSPAS